MIKRLKPQSEFSKNVLTLMTGTTVAQAIPIAITPILTRLYTPEDFGILALFIAITTILGSIANGRYELAIMLPKNDRDAINIASVGMVITFSLSVLLVIPVTFFNEDISRILGHPEIALWLYFVPFVVLMMGGYNVLSFLNVRKKFYKDIARSNIYKATGSAATQLTVGALYAGPLGLISGNIVSQILANYRLALNVRARYQLKDISSSEMNRLARRYVDFPKVSMWAVLANSLSLNLVNVLISLYYSVSTLGFYSLAQRLLNMPATLVGRSIGQVYFETAAKEKHLTGKAVESFRNTSIKLLILSVVFFIPVYFLLPFAFRVVFGEKWIESAVYGQIILPLLACQFIASALSNTNNVFEKQRIALAWQVSLLGLVLFSIFLSQALDLSFENYLRVNTVILFAHYTLLYLLLNLVARGKI